MEKKAKSNNNNNIKNENNYIKKNVNPFRLNENNMSSNKLGKYEFDNTKKSYIKNKHYSDRKLKINFGENKARKSIKEPKRNKNINENMIKLKSNINKVNIISFTNIDQKDIYKWKEILYNHNREFSITQLNESITNNDDEKILNQKETIENNDDNFADKKNNLDDFDVIRKDVIRTRVNEAKLIKEYEKNLELLIKYFIKENKVKYKQGLNEIIGAFLLLKYSNIKEDMTFSEIYNLLNGFINLLVFNYYFDESIYSIKNSFSLLTLLLKYHAPEINSIFEKAMVYPELYATSWILTVFAYKLQLNTLFYFWNKIILGNDELIIHYLIISLLIYKKSLFMNVDIGSIPIVINKISIETEKDIDIIYAMALNLREKTPYSFRLLAQKLDVLNHRSTQHKLKYELYHPDTLISMPIFPSEIFFICYRNIIKCPDENHIKNLNIKAYCEHCDMKIEKKINYILFDLRILEKGKFESNNEKTGFLPQMIMIKQKELNDENLINIVDNRFNEVKNKYHFIFMSSKIDFLNANKEERGIDTNNNEVKIVNLDKKTSKKFSQTEKNIIKENENLRKLILFLIKNNYQYISYIYGGFETIHNEIMNNSKKISSYSEINLLNHNDEKCYICKKNTKILKALSPKINKKSINKINFISPSPKKSVFAFSFNKNEKNLNNENKTEKIYKTITIEEVNKMISKSQNFASPCRFINLENTNSDEKNDDDKRGLLIIYENKLFAIKTPAFNNKPIEIIHEIPLTNIKSTNIKDKFYAHINFIISNGIKTIKEFLIAKFFYEIDSKKFISSINKGKKRQS